MELLLKITIVLFAIVTALSLGLGIPNVYLHGLFAGLLWSATVLFWGYAFLSGAIASILLFFTAIQLAMLDMLQDKERQVAEEKHRLVRLGVAGFCLVLPPMGALAIKTMVENHVRYAQVLDFDYFVVIGTGLMFIFMGWFLWSLSRHRGLI